MNKVKLFESYDVEETEREVNKFLKNLEDTGLGYFMDLKVSTSQGNGSLTKMLIAVLYNNIPNKL